MVVSCSPSVLLHLHGTALRHRDDNGTHLPTRVDGRTLARGLVRLLLKSLDLLVQEPYSDPLVLLSLPFIRPVLPVHQCQFRLSEIRGSYAPRFAPISGKDLVTLPRLDFPY